MGASNAVSKYVSSLFGSNNYSDCTVVFYLESAVCPSDGVSEGTVEPGGGESVAQRQHLDTCLSTDGGAAGVTGSGEEGPVILGEPLPAHRLVLSGCSERFAAELERWHSGAVSPADVSTDGATSPSGAPPVYGGRPVLRVPLGSEAELPGALAAIRFAYTGEVAAASVREALEVHKQAAYLGVEGCGAACSSRIRTLLEADDLPGSGKPSQPLQEIFACSAMWPPAAEEPSFAAVLAFAKQRLVKHFGDTLGVLNDERLREQLVGLPAVALEALLESDDFGTDTESSVLLLLAEWMAVNHDRTTAATRERLCRLLPEVSLSVREPQCTFFLALMMPRTPDAAAGGGLSLESFAAYIHEGKMSGSLTLLPPNDDDGEDGFTFMTCS
ncbi:hypothetical protein GPECTOR_11g240 [Gonium pectorale]|uniref:BTB domain-containing protein n=1 Tax=Gonium pectorale TaxID=33097 RepID=A0A150GPY6_GONPE|nr:hypothetical protein GPECTOR_11g240 [Gonium pectorale]|eukprot:KXZ51798.1 hypothetical protein GPECTOR_11g240 [Gonium pectorale]